MIASRDQRVGCVLRLVMAQANASFPPVSPAIRLCSLRPVLVSLSYINGSIADSNCVPLGAFTFPETLEIIQFEHL